MQKVRRRDAYARRTRTRVRRRTRVVGRRWSMVAIAFLFVTAAPDSGASSCALRLHKVCDHADYPQHGRPRASLHEYTAWHNAWEARCATPVRTAARIASNTLLRNTSLEIQKIPQRFKADNRKDTEWSFVPRVLETALRSRHGCLVYSFGVAGRDEFTDFHAAQGCRVFAFDPTIDHPRAWKENVTFHPWGLRSAVGKGEHEVKSLGQYGSVFGELLSLREIMRRVGHPPDALIAAFKLDCEGCEFATFEELWCGGASDAHHPSNASASADDRHGGAVAQTHELAPPPQHVAFAPRIVSISIELHFWVHHRMHFSEDVERIRYAGLYLSQHRYRTFSFQTHKGAIIPYRGEAAMVHPDLQAAGLDRTTCCYMYGWVREELLDAF